jgi:hypothetical protein
MSDAGHTDIQPDLANMTVSASPRSPGAWFAFFEAEPASTSAS